MDEKRVWSAIPLLVILFFALACDRRPAVPAPTAGNLNLGDPLPEFALSTMDGQLLRLSDYLDGTRYVCVVWHSPACPCARNCAVAVRDGLAGPEYADVAFVAVASGPESDLGWWREDLKAQIDDGTLTYPVGIDRDGAVMRQYGAKRTPTVWLADKEGRIRFWGAPETTLETTAENYRLTIKEALDDLKAGRPVATPSVEPIGCLIPGV